MLSLLRITRGISFFALITIGYSAHAVAVFPQDSTSGVDGAFSLSTSLDLTVPGDGIFNFTDFHIDADGDLHIASDSPVFLYANDFLIEGSIYAATPELYLIGSSIELRGSSRLISEGLIGLYGDSAAISGEISAQSGSGGSGATLTAGLDVPELSTAGTGAGSMMVIGGDISFIDPVILQPHTIAYDDSVQLIIDDAQLGDIQLVTVGELTVTPVPLPAPALLLLSGLLALFARRRA
jgi:hypothetical protein